MNDECSSLKLFQKHRAYYVQQWCQLKDKHDSQMRQITNVQKEEMLKWQHQSSTLLDIIFKLNLLMTERNKNKWNI